jgi:hypothetical protein
VLRTTPSPSAAHTRWQVAAPFRRAGGQCPGHPAFALTLLRHRGGREGWPPILPGTAMMPASNPRCCRNAAIGAVYAVAAGRKSRA